jgi:hypothetical protein
MENINIIIKKMQNIIHDYLYKDSNVECEPIDKQLESILPLIYQIKDDYNLDDRANYIKKLNNKIANCELAEQDAKLNLQYEIKENENLILEIYKLKEEIELLKNEKFNKIMFINELKDHLNDRDNIIKKLNNNNKEKDNEIKNLKEILTEKTEKINSLNNTKMDLIAINNNNTNYSYIRSGCIIS